VDKRPGKTTFAKLFLPEKEGFSEVLAISLKFMNLLLIHG